jgi:hypothetical protein
MWSVCEREVNKQPHNTMASLKAKISEVMADIERKVVIRACGLRLLWRPVGILLNK